MQSAFQVEDSKRLMFETTSTTISVYYCDQNWQKIKEFANFELTSHQEEYHLFLRRSYLPKYFVEEQSSVITE
jgi:hypothetical protein